MNRPNYPDDPAFQNAHWCSAPNVAAEIVRLWSPVAWPLRAGALT
jgi:hypothetical protein